MASAGRLSAKIKKNVNGFALQPGLFLGARQGTGWPQAKMKKRERFLHLYSKISFGLGRLGPSGPQAVLGPKPLPFIFILADGRDQNRSRFYFSADGQVS